MKAGAFKLCGNCIQQLHSPTAEQRRARHAHAGAPPQPGDALLLDYGAERAHRAGVGVGALHANAHDVDRVEDGAAHHPRGRPRRYPRRDAVRAPEGTVAHE